MHHSHFAAYFACAAVLLSVNSRAEEIYQLEEIIVESTRHPLHQAAMSSADLESSGAPNVGKALLDLPGISGVHRGADAVEPVIRGMGWERVETQVGCLPLYGACPARMDPPVTYVSPESVDSVRVVKGLTSVTLGPGGTGGRIVMDANPPVVSQDENALSGRLRTKWDEGRDGSISSMEVRGSTPALQSRAEVSYSDLGDYTSADGKTVPAGMESIGGALSLGWKAGEDTEIYGMWTVKEERDVDYPSLPMDIERSTANLFILGATRQYTEGALSHISAEAGYASVDHVMNNARKSNRRMMQAETESEAVSVSTRVEAGIQSDTAHALRIGADYQQLERDALRLRMMSGMTLRDPVWPDVTRDIFGLFGEHEATQGDRYSWTVGARLDAAGSDASGADKTLNAGGAATVRDQYARFYGPGAAETDRDEVLWSGNVKVESRVSETVYLHAGIGRVERYPSVTEMYFAFAPSPGGYLVGNPSLDPEEKYEASIGVVYDHGLVNTEVSLFASSVENYIYQAELARLDVNGDGTPDRVRGFENIDAEFYGAEMLFNADLGMGLSTPLTLSYVRGKNTTNDRDLPEIPPLEVSAALHYQFAGVRDAWAEFGMRAAAEQDRVDEAFPEDETRSFEVFYLKGGVTLGMAYVEFGVENLFDEAYNEHLSREVLLPSGDLAAGDEVPAPGRYFYLSAAIDL